MEQLRPGLWWWTAPHPDWKPTDAGPTGWDRDVSCYAVELGDGLVLIDPQSPPPELTRSAVAVALTCEWHARDARGLGLPLWEPKAGGEPPRGIEPRPPAGSNEVALWLPAHEALVFGDIVSVRDGRADVNWGWVDAGVDRSTTDAALRLLLDLPIELVLPGHGTPVRTGGKDALAAALER